MGKQLLTRAKTYPVKSGVRRLDWRPAMGKGEATWSKRGGVAISMGTWRRLRSEGNLRHALGNSRL
jgi:hypothetical protein